MPHHVLTVLEMTKKKKGVGGFTVSAPTNFIHFDGVWATKGPLSPASASVGSNEHEGDVNIRLEIFPQEMEKVIGSGQRRTYEPFDGVEKPVNIRSQTRAQAQPKNPLRSMQRYHQRAWEKDRKGCVLVWVLVVVMVIVGIAVPVAAHTVHHGGAGEGMEIGSNAPS